MQQQNGAARAEAVAPVPETEAKPKRAKRKPGASRLMAEGEPVSANIVYCADGKYRWLYRMDLLRNPTVFLLVWKIFFFILLAIFAITSLVDLIQWGFDAESALSTLKFFGCFLLGMTMLVGISCLVFAAIMGGSYDVLFEMDERGVNHRQLPRQIKKAQLISDLTVLAGLAAGKPTTVGVGLNAARTEMYSEFSRVRKLKAYPRRGLIKVNGLLSRNQVYAAPEDFAFVYEYIEAHCENLKT